jgi:hypothetical protein
MRYRIVPHRLLVPPLRRDCRRPEPVARNPSPQIKNRAAERAGTLNTLAGDEAGAGDRERGSPHWR